MEISERRIEDVDIVALNGRLDISSAKKLKNRMNTLVKENRVRLILDMTGVDFIDSSGLGSLVSSLRSVNAKNGDVKLAGLRQQVYSIFELTRLHRVFTIFDDVESAMKTFS